MVGLLSQPIQTILDYGTISFSRSAPDSSKLKLSRERLSGVSTTLKTEPVGDSHPFTRLQGLVSSPQWYRPSSMLEPILVKKQKMARRHLMLHVFLDMEV